MNGNKITLSPLNHTWILDLDGTIVKHNGYKEDGDDSLLEGAETFLGTIPEGDMIIFLTSREEKYREETVTFLAEKKIRYDHIIFGVPYGERILINDRKPSGLDTAIAVNTERNHIIEDSFYIDSER